MIGLSSEQRANMAEKQKALLSDLGKATMRGIRKCPKCGTANGTRGISCKNKTCNFVFKECPEKKKLIVDSVKLITGTSSQIYSVRVRDRGPDYRGFVQLPVIQEFDGTTDQIVNSALLTQTSSKCYIETCLKSKQEDSDGLSFSVETCQHIQSSLNCIAEAQMLALKNSVLTGLQVSDEMRQNVWKLATETPGPLVQRVSKRVMAVKCKEDSKHPLGFLHCSFESPSSREDSDCKFHCSCKDFKLGLKSFPSTPHEDISRRCVHFYACICAFASDGPLSEEFAYYIHLDNSLNPEPRIVAIISNAGQQHEVEVEVLPDNAALLAAATSNTLLSDVRLMKKRKNNNCSPVTFSLPGSVLSMNNKKRLVARKKARPGELEEVSVSHDFQHWLGSVTERINQTMHYQFNGCPEPLVFHIPQSFFECLQHRLSGGAKKKRLPNSTTAFVRRNAVPLGTFSKYTWHITNVLQVKKIFDTPSVLLEVSRSFVKNRDGTYEPYKYPNPEVSELTEIFKKTENSPFIKPMEYKTFLKVGQTSYSQKDLTPFTIEWIPNILPKSQIGELRIKFEYGHQRNGQLDMNPQMPTSVIHIQQQQYR